MVANRSKNPIKAHSLHKKHIHGAYPAPVRKRSTAWTYACKVEKGAYKVANAALFGKTCDESIGSNELHKSEKSQSCGCLLP